MAIYLPVIPEAWQATGGWNSLTIPYGVHHWEDSDELLWASNPCTPPLSTEKYLNHYNNNIHYGHGRFPW